MRSVPRLFILAAALAALAPVGTAQPPRDRPADPSKAAPRGGPAGADGLVARMMAFDKNNDGKLTRDEITDERLLRLFDRADANKDGVVTKEELTALARQMAAEDDRDGPRGGFGPPGFGRGGPGGPPQPGQVMPPFLQEMLDLTADQKNQLKELQKEVDGKLAKILTDEQRKRLQEMRDGPGGRPPGPGGRPGGPGGPHSR